MSANIHTGCKKSTAFAWAKYYEAINRRHTTDYSRYMVFQNTVETLPEHIKSQYLDMMKELKKEWECPVCMEMIQPDNLGITNCGHFFCKPCLTTLKNPPNMAPNTAIKCPICRKWIGHT